MCLFKENNVYLMWELKAFNLKLSHYVDYDSQQTC